MGCGLRVVELEVAGARVGLFWFSLNLFEGVGYPLNDAELVDWMHELGLVKALRKKLGKT